MHALSTPVFSSTALAPANASNRRSAGAVKEVAEHGVAERIEAADRTQQALQETLVRADAMRLELRNRLNKMQVTRNTPLPPISSDGLESDLWQYAPRKGIDFRVSGTRRPFDPSTLLRLNLPYRPLRHQLCLPHFRSALPRLSRWLKSALLTSVR